jgi:uncharacterized protein (TIGR03790 family)
MINLPCSSHRPTPLVLGLLLLGELFFGATAVRAGGGPENVLLVVNPKSAASLTIANHFAHLRRIPPDNWFMLPFNPNAERIDIETFRAKILIPILQAIDKRRLSDQIDYIVYSADFPWGVNLESDVRLFAEQMQKSGQSQAAKTAGMPVDPKTGWLQYLTPVGSLNGLTYLWQAAAFGHPAYFLMDSNSYMRLPIPEQRNAGSAGFRGNRMYNRRGEVVASDGGRYFLSMMLGVTAGRGNSVAEVISYLKRSASADGTHPKGTIYFVRNGDDPRSAVRHKDFPEAARQLKELGVAAEILDGGVPHGKSDIQGLMMGIADFHWGGAECTILPGAICEHFTSFGGIMSYGAGQTPLSVFLRAGAAGSSGTVVEPYAVHQKFPSPMMQVHYARGCSLAEAFYQSVYGPYQLLIVGDPLCRPWAEIPRVFVAGIQPGATVKGSLHLQPSASLDRGAVDHFEVFWDGRRVGWCQPGETFDWNTAGQADGHHDLRFVAVGPRPIETQGRRMFSVWLDNYGRKIALTLKTPPPFRTDAALRIAVNSPGSRGAVALHGDRVVAQIGGEKGDLVIPANTLGAGPVHLEVLALGKGKASTNVIAEPFDLTLQPGAVRELR